MDITWYSSNIDGEITGLKIKPLIGKSFKDEDLANITKMKDVQKIAVKKNKTKQPKDLVSVFKKIKSDQQNQ